jgi:DNA invertase Pin-like site-specific DNA recombinase
MKTVAYFKTSKNRQEIREQRQAIVEFAQREGITVSRFIEMPAFTGEKRIDQLIGHLEPGDTLIVSEFSRIGRSVGQIVRIVDALINAKIRFIAVKENIRLDEEPNSQTQAMVRMFGLLADIDRELVSIHTKEGLSSARVKGKKLGRPKGSLGISKLDGKTGEIQRLLSLGVSKGAIARMMGVGRTTVNHFAKSRGLI